MVSPVLWLQGVGVVYDGCPTPALRDVELRLGAGFYGVVGANGAGKSTLLRVIAGSLAPTSGRRRLAPDEAQVQVVEQEPGDLPEEVRALAESTDRLALRLRGRLYLDGHTLARWDTLSPGERKRWQIAAALATEPEVLLLDEPSNHLDASSTALLIRELGRLRGLSVIVTHDRALLDALGCAILRVDRGAVSAYPGPYGAARQAWQAERAASEEAHRDARSAELAIAARLDAARREHDAASRQRSSRSRMKSAQDHDGRESLRKGRAAFAESRAGRTVGVLHGALERARDAVPRVERDPTVGAEIFARIERAPSPILFHIDADELVAGERIVLRDVRLTVGREDRLRVTGSNGAGKTTLLRAMLASASDAARERILYLPQELGITRVSSLLGELEASSRESRGRTLSIFAALGSDPARIVGRASAESLSPGEARKLAIASALGGHAAWALVLDEPTNHLDLPSVERLERALSLYPGAIVVASHDQAFAEACTERVIHLEGGLAS